MPTRLSYQVAHVTSQFHRKHAAIVKTILLRLVPNFQLWKQIIYFWFGGFQIEEYRDKAVITAPKRKAPPAGAATKAEPSSKPEAKAVPGKKPVVRPGTKPAAKPAPAPAKAPSESDEQEAASPAEPAPAAAAKKVVGVKGKVGKSTSQNIRRNILRKLSKHYSILFRLVSGCAGCCEAQSSYQGRGHLTEYHWYAKDEEAAGER